MFQPNASGAAIPGGIAAPLAAHAAPGPTSGRLRPALRRFKAGRKRLESLGIGLGTEISIDLGNGIGTRGWWFGLVACFGLCATAILLGSMVTPISSPVRPGLTPTQREMLRPQSIAPLAMGGGSGTRGLPSAQLVEALAEAPERPRLELTARTNGRDGFETLLRRAGIGADDIASVIGLIPPNANLAALPGGSAIDIVLGRRATKSVPRPLESLGLRAAFDLRLAIDRDDGALRIKRIPIAVDSTPLRVKGLVGSNVERSLRTGGVPARLANDFIKTMGYAIDFQHGIGKNDRFDIVVERDVAETGDVRYGELLFAGMDRAGKDPVELGRFDLAGHSQYFRASGESAKKGLMRTPVDGARLTSSFGMRFHPLLAYSRMHQGVDFGAPMGSPIFAAANGTVSFAGPHGGHGNYVMIRHNNELSTGYAHLSRFAVRTGQSVSQGQVIGYVGSTGLSTGPHLHYEIWLRGQPTNPVGLKFIGGSQLSGSGLASFLSMMNRMRALTVAGPPATATATDARRARRSIHNR